MKAIIYFSLIWLPFSSLGHPNTSDSQGDRAYHDEIAIGGVAGGLLRLNSLQKKAEKEKHKVLADLLYLKSRDNSLNAERDQLQKIMDYWQDASDKLDRTANQISSKIERVTSELRSNLKGLL